MIYVDRMARADWNEPLTLTLMFVIRMGLK
jgi:hypothetical protein